MTATFNHAKLVLSVAAIGTVFVIGYYDVLRWMVDRFQAPDSYYSHGFLIPVVSGFLIWKQRSELRTSAPDGVWWGGALVICALALHVFSTVAYIFSFSGFSIFILIWGSVLFLYGPKITQKIAFPLFFLIFMFPVPLAVITTVSFPLKVMVAKIGVGIASMLGIPIHLHGFNITIPAGTLLVGNPCSGLRSLVAFLAIGAALAYISNLTIFKKVVLFLLSLPIAIISNLIRVPILILTSHYYGLKAAEPDTWVHTGSGILVFVLGFLTLCAAAWLLERRSAD